uniref:Reverse transcriptase Ty1/copia-type domain-containing protein n=1 Tax=Tanacetum cinerariifolium TaxID=118510 RepID=A0A6L2K674_TANCI|nr:hypothetical protein [Tanacetum cinerariifolium]
MMFVEQSIGPAPDLETADLDTIDKYYETVNLEQEVACLMLSIKAFYACKQEDGQSVSSYLLKMKSYLDTLERLGYKMPNKLGVCLILNSLNKDYDQFVQNYNMHSMGKMLAKLHAMLKLHEKGEKGKDKGKNKLTYAPKSKIPPDNLAKDSICHHRKEVSHWRRNCLSYHAELKKRKNASVASTSGYAPETTARILNMVLTKKVGRTPYEIWHGKSPKLSYLKVWVMRHSRNETHLTNLIPDPLTMNMEMQSMKDNQVWYLVDLPSNGRTIRCKWLFKKRTDMNGNVHTFKAPLVANGFTETYIVDYGETFSPVADITAIRILLAISAFYDYVIWQMDVKEAFLNGYIREAAYIFGIKIIHRSKRLITLSQSAYLEKILNKIRMENSKKGYTPIMEKPDYRKSQGAKTPTVSFKYLMNTKNMVLVYGAKPEDELKVSCYADGSFQTDKNDTKSQTGYVFVLNGGAVDWKSAKQSTTPMSFIEAEYIAAAEASMEAVWMRKFIDGLGSVMPSNKRPMEILCDNEPALAIGSDPETLKGARQFQRKYHYIHKVIQEGEIFLKKVHTYDNVADPFTKPVPVNKHFKHVMAIGIVPVSSLM